MKVVIDGTEYDASLQPFIGDLRLIKKEFGFGWGTVMTRMQELDTDQGVGALLDDDGFIEALVAWMWMVRRRAGESSLSRADAERVALDKIEWSADPSEERETDPTQASARTASGPVDAKLAAVN